MGTFALIQIHLSVPVSMEIGITCIDVAKASASTNNNSSIPIYRRLFYMAGTTPVVYAIPHGPHNRFMKLILLASFSKGEKPKLDK